MVQLTTKWAAAMDPDRVLPEYPRPNLVRDSYFNLNGRWDYQITDSETPGEYQGTILVPFSPETALSGVQKILQPGQYLHYKKQFTLPEGFRKDRVLLHFGAVDQECAVWLNGSPLGEHKGGYLPFCFDVTDALQKGVNTLTLRAKDSTEYSPHARGKQRLHKKGKFASLFYTPQSGIWKTVWMESVPAAYVTGIVTTPLFDEGAVQIAVSASEPEAEFSLSVLDGGRPVTKVLGRAGRPVRVQLGNEFVPWTPEQPHLYDVKIKLGTDEVSTYFGMRKFSTGRDKNGLLRFFLNNRPFFFNGVLDQGYWPESLLTAPSDEAMVYDIQKMKQMNYNTIRKHIKIESERFYYHCDRLGMVVWQDMPCGGGVYDMFFVTTLPNAFNWFARGVSDRHYKAFRREDAEGRAQYYRDLEQMVRTLYNYPSIAVWVPFNEGWGQFDAPKATALIRRIDPTRLVNEACGWFDQKGGDMYSIHNYLRPLKITPQKDRVTALTEYGGYAYPVAGHMACEKEFGYRHCGSAQQLTEDYEALWERDIFPNLSKGLCSAIYTQTSDIEEEINGLMTYDRAVDKFLIDRVAALHQRMYDAFAALTDQSASADKTSQTVSPR